MQSRICESKWKHQDRIDVHVWAGREARRLKPGYTIVEATSGNTGIAFSMVAAIKGYKMVWWCLRRWRRSECRSCRPTARVVYARDEYVEGSVRKPRNSQSSPAGGCRQFDNLTTSPPTARHRKEILAQVRRQSRRFIASVGTGRPWWSRSGSTCGEPQWDHCSPTRPLPGTDRGQAGNTRLKVADGSCPPSWHSSSKKPSTSRMKRSAN